MKWVYCIAVVTGDGRRAIRSAADDAFPAEAVEARLIDRLNWHASGPVAFVRLVMDPWDATHRLIAAVLPVEREALRTAWRSLDAGGVCLLDSGDTDARRELTVELAGMSGVGRGLPNAGACAALVDALVAACRVAEGSDAALVLTGRPVGPTTAERDPSLADLDPMLAVLRAVGPTNEAARAAAGTVRTIAGAVRSASEAVEAVGRMCGVLTEARAYTWDHGALARGVFADAALLCQTWALLPADDALAAEVAERFRDPNRDAAIIGQLARDIAKRVNRGPALPVGG